MKRSLPLLVFLWIPGQILWGAPIIIPATNILGTPNSSSLDISGKAYRFNTEYTSIGSAPHNLSVNTILSEPMFNATNVGSFLTNTTNGINYGKAPNFPDNITLSNFLQSDGLSLVYNGNNVGYSNNNVFTPATTHAGLPGVGTLLTVTGYIYIPQALVNQPLTYSIKADDGSYLAINNTVVINNGGLHPPTLVSKTAEYTKAGLYPVSLGYYDGSPVEGEFQVIFPAGTIFLESVSQFDPIFNVGGLTHNQASVATYINNALLCGKLDSQINCLCATVADNPAAAAAYFDEFSPMKFQVFANEAASDYDDFVIQEMDNYLADKRNLDGTLVETGGLNDSGLTLNSSSSDETLQSIQNRLNTASSSTAPTNSRWNTLLSGNVILAQTYSDASAGISHSDTTSEAVLLGEDYRFTPHFLTGVLFGYDHSSAALDNIGSNARLDAYSPGFYASYADKGWYSNTLGSFSFDDYSQRREVDLPCGGVASSSPSGWQAMLNTDAGYDFHSGRLTYGPTFGVHYTHQHLDSYNETALYSGNLNVSEVSDDSLRSRLGVRLRYPFTFNGISITPHGSVVWQHEFLDGLRGVSAQFSDLDAGSYSLQAPSVSRDSALADLGIDAQVNETVTCFASYYVNVGQADFFAQSVQAGVKIAF